MKQSPLMMACALALVAVPVSGVDAAAKASELKCVVFQEQGFPAADSEAVDAEALRASLAGFQVSFAGVGDLTGGEVLRDAALLVLPYGSAFPAEGWSAIRDYVRDGGNVLTLGGRPFFVPVRREQGRFVVGAATNAYARDVGVSQVFEAPRAEGARPSLHEGRLAWEDDFALEPPPAIRARRIFSVSAAGPNAGYLRGLAYIEGPGGERVSAPITRLDYIGGRNGFTSEGGARCVFLSIDPEPGYWASPEGRRLVTWAAEHAARGAASLWLEVAHATLAPGEPAQVVVHLQRGARGAARAGEASVRVELMDGARVLATRRVPCAGSECRVPIVFVRSLEPGLYTLRGVYEDARGSAEGYLTGVWSRDPELLARGAPLEVEGETFRVSGVPYLPMGVNYFSGDVYATSFFAGDNSCGNAYRWERDFAEMERLGLTFVRTGTWGNHDEYFDKVTGGADERYLRALEAFLHSAARHHMQVQFTFFAFDPQSVRRFPPESHTLGPGAHPYLDPRALQAQSRFIHSIVSTFQKVPFLSWDLINEPNFANPLRLWSGNVPNGDPVELAAWRKWLRQRYGGAGALAAAWSTTAEALGGDDLAGVAIPGPEALSFRRNGSSEQMRAFDFNLFAQEAFTGWTRRMIAAVREAGGRQLVAVGQDEGGVSDRLLTQFYADAGVAFTTNHTWWYDDAILWASFAAKRPDRPSLIGETGVQSAWRVDGTWRQDEQSARGLVERKLALGYAAGSLGSVYWDWSRGEAFQLLRVDGSRKIWAEALGGVARFARDAGPRTGRLVRPEVAVVLPQTLQLSIMNRYAQEAQQKCVRALFQQARGAAYAVGEHQLALLGEPKLILVPSPWVLSEGAWQTLLDRVRSGAVLAITGPVTLDEHFRPVDRLASLGLEGGVEPIQSREVHLRWPGGDVRLTFGGDKTTYLERGRAERDSSLVTLALGRGRILYCPWPLELNDNPDAVGRFYRMALDAAAVRPTFTSDEDDPGILICPTRFQDGTLYVLTSESAAARQVTFRDTASGATLGVALEPGRAALGFVLGDGHLAARYGNWRAE